MYKISTDDRGGGYVYSMNCSYNAESPADFRYVIGDMYQKLAELLKCPLRRKSNIIWGSQRKQEQSFRLMQGARNARL